MRPRLPSREQLLSYRWLRPLARHLQDERLWHINRQSVARAVAIGVFFGLLLPFAQFLFAVGTAVALRAHVALSAASTFISNPLTFPPIYWLAYRIGTWVLDHASGPDEADQVAQTAQQQAEALTRQLSWLEAGWQWLQSAGAPLLVGLMVMACVGSLLAYVLVLLLWRPARGTAPPPAD